MNTQIKIKVAQHNLKKWWIAKECIFYRWAMRILLLVGFIAAALVVVS